MIITFVKDVTLPNEKGGPHYTAGYSCDVSDAVARAHVQSGDAVYGATLNEAREGLGLPLIPGGPTVLAPTAPVADSADEPAERIVPRGRGRLR